MGRESITQTLRAEKTFNYAESEGSTSPGADSQSSFNESPESLKSSRTSAGDSSKGELEVNDNDDDMDELHSDDVIHGELHLHAHLVNSHWY